MNWFSSRGRASRVSVAARRRVARYAPSLPESLEERRLLAAGNFGINVEISPFASFVNLLQAPGSWSNSSNTVVLNSSGDPESDASLTFDLRVNQSFNGPDPNAVGPNLAGTYHLSFNGQATILVEYQGFSTPFTVQNQVYNAATNTTTADLVVPTTNYSDFFGISFVNTQATATSAVNTGFSNATLIRPGYAAGSTQLYTNEFLAALKPYSVLRYLDPENTNNQPFYNGTTLATVAAPQVDQTGMPWEYLIALANATQTDMWVNVPEGATNAYVSAMAGIFKNGGTVDGVSYPGLNSNLKIYLEYSNEVWGGIPFNQLYQESAVQNTSANQPLSTFPSNLDIYNNVDGSTTTDVNTAVGRRYLERTNDISQIFQGVLGSDPTHQRIRPVLGWQENDPSFYPAALDWFQHFFGPASNAFYGIGNANYVYVSDYSSVDAVIDSLASQEATYSIPNNIDDTTLAAYYGLKNVAYEGGPSITGDGTTAGDEVAEAASRDPRMEQLILQHYLDFFADGGDTAMLYSGPFSIWSPANEWTDAELSQYGNPTASAKYRGTVDVAAASPTPVTAGIQVASSGVTSFSASTDSLGSSASSPTTGQQNYWLLNVASAGTDDLKLTTNASGGTVPGQVEVFLNDKQVGGIISVPASSSIDLGNLILAAGLNTISIEVIHGANDPSQVNYQFSPATFTLTASSPGMPLLADSGFENVPIALGGIAYDPSGSSWTFAGSPGNGSGLTANDSGFTASNPTAPQGSQVAFLQGVSSITQTVSGWAAGSYAISFDASQRANGGGSQNFEVLVDGKVMGTFKTTTTTYQVDTTPSFTVSAGSHVVEFLGLDSAGGDNTALLDAVSVAVASTTPPTVPTVPTVGDAGFETIPVASGGLAYDPSGSAWTFAGSPGNGSGLTANNSGFTASNPTAPQGSQVAFLQGVSSITQTVSGWAAGSYTISFDAAKRANGGGTQDFEVLVDGKVVGTFKTTTTAYQVDTTPSFAVSAGSHVVEFLGLDSAGGDNTALLDAVSVAVASTTPPAVPTVGDAGFETIPVASGGLAYDPSGSAWTFAGSPGNGSGVTANNSGFTASNPTAPQGSQVAFLQGVSSITQSVSGWAAGSYTISFDVAQRANGGGTQDFEVLVDGKVVGTFKTTTSTYQVDTTSSFIVTAGAHAVEFLGLDSAGGDNTALLDAVSVL